MSKVRVILRGPVLANDGKPVRAEGAIAILIHAYLTPPGSKLHHDLLKQAMLHAVFGTINEHQFRQRGDRRGRPRNEKTKTLVKKLLARMDDGEKPTPAAAVLLRAHGFKGETKGRADHLVRQAKAARKTNI
jgi:hypothetical protein